MSKIVFLLALAVMASAVSLAAQSDRYIVKLKPGESPDAVIQYHGVSPGFVFRKVINGFNGALPPGQLKRLQEDPRVEAIVPDLEVMAFGKPSGGGTIQTVPAGVQRIGAAPGAVTFKGAGVGVAVLDTGLDFGHADLIPLGGASFWAYATSAQDDAGHGTHVGGIIAARANNRDVVGVAPNATLYAVKVLNSQGSGYDSDIIAGLDWVALNWNKVTPNIRVINMSLGRNASDPAYDYPMQQAIQAVVAAGITVVMAAGNDSSMEVSQMVPAGFPEVIAVASTTAITGTANRIYGSVAADTASIFTTDGKYDALTGIGVTISAPGEDSETISGGFIQSVGILSTKLGGGTTRMSGTSMAAPHAAGVVALLYEQQSANLNFTPGDAKRKLMAGDRETIAPLDWRTSKGYGSAAYSYDGEHEGILSVSQALSAP